MDDYNWQALAVIGGAAILTYFTYRLVDNTLKANPTYISLFGA